MLDRTQGSINTLTVTVAISKNADNLNYQAILAKSLVFILGIHYF